MHHHPVGALVQPAGFRIAGDAVAAGADIAAAIGLVPLRRREDPEIDSVAGQDVLQDRPVLDRDVRDRRIVRVVVDLEEGLAQLQAGEARGEAQRGIGPLAAEEVGEDAKALGNARDVVEQAARRRSVALQQGARHADLPLPG